MMPDFWFEMKRGRCTNSVFFVVNFRSRTAADEFCNWLQQTAAEGGASCDEQAVRSLSQHILNNLVVEHSDGDGCFAIIWPEQMVRFVTLLTTMLGVYSHYIPTECGE